MYEIPYQIENEYLSPPEPDESNEKCSYCRQNIVYGEECGIIGNEYIFCQYCMENELYTETYEKENYFEEVI